MIDYKGCFVLVPDGTGGWERLCFSVEFRLAGDWMMTVDHVFPRSHPSRETDGSTHLAHAGCQNRQGGRIRALDGSPSKDMTSEKRREVSSLGGMSGGPAGGRASASIRKDRGDFQSDEWRASCAVGGSKSRMSTEDATRVGKLGAEARNQKYGSPFNDFTPEQRSEYGRLAGAKGGKSRVESMTPEELSDAARAAGLASAASLTPEERTARSKYGSHVRWHLNRGIADPECSMCTEPVTLDTQDHS